MFFLNGTDDTALEPSGAPAAPAVPAPSLLGQVLLINAVGFGVAAFAARLFSDLPIPPHSWIMASPLLFGLVAAINLWRENDTLCLGLFYAFTFAAGACAELLLGPFVTAGEVANAALTTGLGIFALGAVVYATGLDLRSFTGALRAAFFGLIPVVLVVVVFGDLVHPQAVSWGILMIFAGLLMADFARVRAGVMDSPRYNWPCASTSTPLIYSSFL